MCKKTLWALAASCALFILAIPSRAQSSDVQEKPALYSYVSHWAIPRAHWAEMKKASEADNGILEKAMADGSIVGYGHDETMVHQADSGTHDDWWEAHSMAALLKVLDQFYASGSTTADPLSSATAHSDSINVSHYYNWKPGPYKNAYTHVAAYQLKKDAPDDAVDTLSKTLVVPLLEKLLSDGALLEYEVDTEAIHTTDPSFFWIIYTTSSPEGLDKVNAALAETIKNQPLSGPAFGSMTELKAHRDELIRGDGVYK
ncbi:MAG TPA: hypothetical protein VKR52_19860 [Terracidiphilus sp.]|nr:hypothetical protein [Terracidiphilus sp.]